ncbi:MAG: hypothetical protein P8J50_02570 [Acidimicrobiales bacterium]|jgi:hypothetical protein|nr:hypothetical protein [Acidimicrobiales bacterium]
MSDSLDLVAKLGAITNMTHGFIYFAPEASEEYEAVGLPATYHYFASRGACFGPVPAGVIVATFFNFNPALVHDVIPEAWTLAAPADIQDARMRAAGRVLSRMCADSDVDIDAATALAGKMMDGLGDEGRALAAANRAVPEPDDPWERLWQRITVLREWRGDAHVSALVSAPVDPVEALALHAATDQVPKAALVATRQWPEDKWNAGVERLIARGLLVGDGQFSDEGRAFRDDIEHRTNDACIAMVDAVGPDETRRFIDLLKPVRGGLIEGGAFAMMGR